MCQKLIEYPKIHFLEHKMNGEYQTIIKCNHFYSSYFSSTFSSIYQDYTYLYTTLSFILCTIIIDYYEELLIKIQLKQYQSFISPNEMKKMKGILSLFLDSNYPSESAKQLFLLKKELIFRQLLLHFKHQNYLTIEAFALFSLTDYYFFLKTIISESFLMSLSYHPNKDFLNFILNIFLK